MKFQLLPTLASMAHLYQQPRSPQRFHQLYLPLLQGNSKSDLAMPISAWNPMAKEHILDKIEELQALKAEEYVAELLALLNQELPGKSPDKIIQVSLAIADDLKGGWTNRYTTDYDMRFKLNALVQRNFCTPLFWSSENFSLEKIKKRTLEACFRTIYWLEHPKPRSLVEHLRQELFVTEKLGGVLTAGSAQQQSFFQQHQHTADHALIFNFLYGDQCCRELNFGTFGNESGWLLAPANFQV